MKGKTVLVTGATDGIGKQTALTLVRMGADVIVHGRDPVKTEHTVKELRAAVAGASVEGAVADLSSMRNVESLAARVQQITHRLDALINNAGVFMTRRVLTHDGLETTFAVNHVAPFMLTALLLDLIKRSAGRVITVSSGAHQRGVVDLNNLQGEKSYDAYSAYALSKLGNILFTYALGRRLERSGATANTLHPGVISTKLLKTGFGSTGGTVEEGADTPVYLASAPEVGTVSGKYFIRRQQVPSSPASNDPALQEVFWTATERLIHV